MTQREIFNVMVAIVNDMDNEALAPYMEHILDTEGAYKDVLVQGIEDRIEALNKKSTGSKKPTKTQIENEGIYANILALMADGAARTNKAITDIYNTLYGTDYSTNKIQAQVTKAVKGGALDRAVIKGVVYFTIKGDTTPTTTDDPTEDVIDDVEE